jgi:hypothetical protein
MAESTTTDEPSKPGLIGGLVNGAKELAGAHIDRIRGELRDEVDAFKSGLKESAIAVGVIIVAAILAGNAIALGLSALGLEAWLAFAIVATVAAGIGIAILKRPRPSADLVPEESLADAKADVERIAREAGDALDRD